MARGNDAEAAQAELEKKLGTELNAEQLIAANRARFSTELLAAQRKAVDPEATEALDPKKVESALGKGREVRDYAVRGDQVVIVYVFDNGRGPVTEKIAVPIEDVQSGKKRKAAKKDDVPEDAPATDDSED